MAAAVTSWLVQRPGGTFLDATVGAGGHTRALLESAGPTARVVAVDQDPVALALAAQTVQGDAARVIFRHGRFEQLEAILDELKIDQLDGALFDLGVSSMQLEAPARGFSFQTEGPLDMRMDPTQSLTAAEIVNRWPESDVAELIGRYGEERWARRIARAIVRRRPLTTTVALARCVLQAVPRGGAWQRIHPATRTFQAIRITVNRELEALEAAVPRGIHRLRPGARIVVLAYQSLEDRIVKRAFRLAEASGVLRVLTRRPVRPAPEEVRDNPRSRSARLRAGERAG